MVSATEGMIHKIIGRPYEVSQAYFANLILDFLYAQKLQSYMLNQNTPIGMEGHKHYNLGKQHYRFYIANQHFQLCQPRVFQIDHLLKD